MSDAWIIGGPGEVTATVDRELADLGFLPHRAQTVEAFELGATTRLPALLVLMVDLEANAAHIAAHDELSKLPLVVVVVDGGGLARGGLAAVGHELMVYPWSPQELQTRVARARHAVRAPQVSDLVVSGSLEINTATYQVSVAGRPVDFTYMEYELLKFFVTHPDRVFSREALLSNVWGYDYFGGARTVDVHIRRLRSKLGQEHADHIRTLRSVGYRWDSHHRAP